MDAFGILDKDFREYINGSLRQYEGDDRLFENFLIENDKITRCVEYQGKTVREGKAQPFDQIVDSIYFDGQPIQYMFSREDGRDDIITRFEIGNKKKAHGVVIAQVHGPNMDQLLSTYFCRGRTYIKKWVKIA